MKKRKSMTNNTFILWLDILGFSQLIESKSPPEVYKIVDLALESNRYYEYENCPLSSLAFSDTILIWHRDEPDNHWKAFFSLVSRASTVCSRLLANGIPVRGAISYGDFTISQSTSKRDNIFFGNAMLDAYRTAEQEQLIGIIVTKQAYEKMMVEPEYEGDERQKGISAYIESINREPYKAILVPREDGSQVVNHYLAIRRQFSWNSNIKEGIQPYGLDFSMHLPEEFFAQELCALRFIFEQASEFACHGDHTSRIAIKYHNSLAFAKRTLEWLEWGNAYSWALEIMHYAKPVGDSFVFDSDKPKRLVHRVNRQKDN
jgi:hypothetical protein